MEITALCGHHMYTDNTTQRNPWTQQLYEDIQLLDRFDQGACVASLLGHDNASFATLFADPDVAASFAAKDPSILRRAWLTGAWEREDMLQGPQEPYRLHSNTEHGGEYVCAIEVNGNICGCAFATLRALVAHQKTQNVKDMVARHKCPG